MITVMIALALTQLALSFGIEDNLLWVISLFIEDFVALVLKHGLYDVKSFLQVSRDGDSRGLSSVDLTGSADAIAEAKRMIADAGVEIQNGGGGGGSGWWTAGSLAHNGATVYESVNGTQLATPACQ